MGRARICEFWNEFSWQIVYRDALFLSVCPIRAVCRPGLFYTSHVAMFTSHLLALGEQICIGHQKPPLKTCPPHCTTFQRYQCGHLNGKSTDRTLKSMRTFIGEDCPALRHSTPQFPKEVTGW